jgi:hypothetical protein
MSKIEHVALAIQRAALGLLGQHKYSNGYTSVGDSDIAEANIVIQVAASFIGAGCHVWAESPFKGHEDNQCKRLDLLVDVASNDPEYPTLLTIEAKRIASGEKDKKVEEILTDYERIRSWQTLDETKMPLFYSVAHSVEWFYGALVVIVPEACDIYGCAVTPWFSEWWKYLTTRPHGFSEAGVVRLEEVLKTAVVRDFERADDRDGFDEENPVGRRLAVTYALFDFGPGPGSLHTAKHEAAHAVVAWRLQIPVRSLVLTGVLAEEGELRGGTVCDWESLRGTLSNREACIRGFAVAYAGALHDARTEEGGGDFDEIFNQLPTDSSVAEYVRGKLIEWEQMSPAARTDEESSEGYQRADHLIGEELDRIERLGKHLLGVRQMDEQAIQNWFTQDDTMNK